MNRPARLTTCAVGIALGLALGEGREVVIKAPDGTRIHLVEFRD